MSPRVLLVDDDELIRRALSTSLKRAGFQVVTADDGIPAMRMAQSMLFDCVVVDYHMKTSTGAEVVRYYKELYGANVYCAVLSGEDTDETRAACHEAGADDVFVKPTSAFELRTRLMAAATLLRGHGV